MFVFQLIFVPLAFSFSAAQAASPVNEVGETPSGETIVVTGKNDPLDRIVCKSRAPTGSRFAERTCRSAREWDASRQQALRDIHEIVDQPRINPH